MTHDELHRVLSYDPETGMFTNRVTRNRAAVAGARAGWQDRNGYRSVKLARKSHLEHRLAWFYVHGEWPAGQIDHFNGDRTDNRLANLRVVSHAGNMQNKVRAARNSSTGLLGVSPNGSGFMAEIEAEGARKYLGTYPTPEEAHATYLSAKRTLHVSTVLTVGQPAALASP